MWPPDDSAARLAACREIRDICRARLTEDPFQQLSRWLAENQFEPASCTAAVAAVDEAPATHAPIQGLKARAADAAVGGPDGTLERCLLLQTALASTERMASLPVPAAVARRLRDEVLFIADRRESSSAYFTAGSNRFAGLCKLVALRRFSAGQFHWEVAGIARRDLLSVKPHRLAGALTFAAFRMGGLQPVFFSHLNVRRERKSLCEDEACRSYHLMARAMALQPSIRGFAACSWFRAPATHAVSPHLGWLSRVFLDNGGFVADAGREDADCGVLHRSETRRRLYEEGRFTPRRGLVMWPRARAIAWATAHPEYAD